jgi:hypothetical protein
LAAAKRITSSDPASAPQACTIGGKPPVSSAVAPEGIAASAKARRLLVQPFENFRKLPPELVKRRANGQLVGEHLLPLHFDCGTFRAVGECGIGGHRNALELAFAGQCAAHDGAIGLKVLPAIQVHHVVEIARTLAFGQGSHLLGEHFLEGVAQDLDATFRQIAVWVVRRSTAPARGRVLRQSQGRA